MLRRNKDKAMKDNISPSEVKSDNEIIAEFMGIAAFDKSGQCTDPEQKYSWRPACYDPLRVEHLQYDTSWDWLHPVIDKIGDMFHDPNLPVPYTLGFKLELERVHLLPIGSHIQQGPQSSRSIHQMV